MALPSSGTIWLSQIQAEFAGPNYWLSTYYRGGGYVTTNNTGVPSGGAIYFSQFYGAVRATSGSTSRGVGTSSLVVPPFQWLTIDVRAGGGGGGGSNIDTYPGSAGNGGGNSHVYNAGANVLAYAGNGGNGSNYYGGVNYDANGNPQAASGGSNGASNYVGGGASGGNGSAYGYSHGQRGGNGGRGVTTYYPGQLTVGGTLTIVVGGGGLGGYAGGISAYGRAASGGDGAVYISWG
jgi:hypothetical protein